MNLDSVKKYFRQLKTPRENRAAVIHPAWERAADLIGENISLQEQPDCDLQGRKLSVIRRQARLELVEAARNWTGAYRDIGPASGDGPGLIFLAGHQPQIFHPGVWLKNFALGRLAELYGATAINLIIDGDVDASNSLLAPHGTPANPSAAQLAFDRPAPAIPYEERRIEDRSMFDSFGTRVMEQMERLIPHPLIEEFWPLVVGQSRETGRLGASIARARHIVEKKWGLNTLEVPQSSVCESEAFRRLVAHLLARLPVFSTVYNESVREYRRLYRLRSASHPAPDLAVEGEWLEAPFWIWSKENPARKRLFARRNGSELLITDKKDINTSLPLSDEGDASRAVEQLADLARRGVKIRSRALVTTLWARLALGDLFIHGIGGGNYDLVTDRIIERFFHRTPPGFMILSATLHLPIVRQLEKSPLPLGEGQGEGVDRRLRELTYHPERFLSTAFDHSKRVPDDVRKLVETKRQWIATPQTVENAKTRCRAIRDVNESLQFWLENQRQQLLELREKILVQQEIERILKWREYGFCLYPENTLRDFFNNLIPKQAVSFKCVSGNIKLLP
jgi:hypothetical protein